MFTDRETLEFDIEVDMPFKQIYDTLDIYNFKAKSIFNYFALVIIITMLGASLYFMRELYYKETKKIKEDWKSIGLKESSLDYITETFDLSFHLKELICSGDMAPVGSYKRSTYTRQEKSNKHQKTIAQNEESEMKAKMIAEFESAAMVYNTRPRKIIPKSPPKENKNIEVT